MPLTLYVMCGSPASGKSTVAAHLATSEGVLIVCPDTIREQNQRWGNARVFYDGHVRTRQALRAGRSVVFDATNIEPVWRSALIQAVKPFHPTIVAIWLTTPLERCLAWHNERQKRAIRLTLSARKLTNMYFHLQDHPPRISEGFSSIVLFDPTTVVSTPSV